MEKTNRVLPPGIETHELASMASAAPPSTAGPVRLSCIDYSPDRVQVSEIDDIEDFIIHHRPQWGTVRWINVDGLSDLNLIRGLAEKYRLTSPGHRRCAPCHPAPQGGPLP
ncbi:MAG: hypothetical protein HC898_10740 [Phycisphaerales bacterium]|nr:hypothetical protein [Phycisphaerales bacterium]